MDKKKVVKKVKRLKAKLKEAEQAYDVLNDQYTDLLAEKRKVGKDLLENVSGEQTTISAKRNIQTIFTAIYNSVWKPLIYKWFSSTLNLTGEDTCSR